MEPCTINAVGIGEYDAATPVEAKDYFGASNDATRQVDLRTEDADENEDGFAVSLIRGGVLRYPHV